MWVAAWVVTGSYTWITFSEMLATNNTVQILYLLFIGCGDVETLWGIVLVIFYYVDDIKHKNAKGCIHYHEHGLLFTFKWLYILCAIGKQIGFTGVYFYRSTEPTERDAHYAYAFTAFLLSIVSNVSLWCRRMVVGVYFSDAGKDLMTNRYKKMFIAVITINGLFILTELIMAILFITMPVGGAYEFTLAFFISLDFGWMVYDLATEPELIKRYKEPMKDIRALLTPKKTKDFIRVIYEKLRKRSTNNHI